MNWGGFAVVVVALVRFDSAHRSIARALWRYWIEYIHIFNLQFLSVSVVHPMHRCWLKMKQCTHNTDDERNIHWKCIERVHCSLDDRVAMQCNAKKKKNANSKVINCGKSLRLLMIFFSSLFLSVSVCHLNVFAWKIYTCTKWSWAENASHKITNEWCHPHLQQSGIIVYLIRAALLLGLLQARPGMTAWNTIFLLLLQIHTKNIRYFIPDLGEWNRFGESIFEALRKNFTGNNWQQ